MGMESHNDLAWLRTKNTYFQIHIFLYAFTFSIRDTLKTDMKTYHIIFDSW